MDGDVVVAPLAGLLAAAAASDAAADRLALLRLGLLLLVLLAVVWAIAFPHETAASLLPAATAQALLARGERWAQAALSDTLLEQAAAAQAALRALLHAVLGLF